MQEKWNRLGDGLTGGAWNSWGSHMWLPGRKWSAWPCERFWALRQTKLPTRLKLNIICFEEDNEWKFCICMQMILKIINGLMFHRVLALSPRDMITPFLNEATNWKKLLQWLIGSKLAFLSVHFFFQAIILTILSFS